MSEKQLTRADWMGKGDVAGGAGNGAEEIQAALREITDEAQRPKCQAGPEAWLAPLAAIAPDTPGYGQHNQGYIYRKIVRRGPDNKELVQIQPIPICTDRTDTVVRGRMMAAAPRPPGRNVVFTPDSEQGQALGLTTKTAVTVPDTTDRGYREALNDFALEQLWVSVAEAIDVPLRFKDAKGATMAAETPEQKVLALKQFGFTNAQIQEGAMDVMRISSFTKAEKRSFFGHD